MEVRFFACVEVEGLLDRPPMRGSTQEDVFICSRADGQWHQRCLIRLWQVPRNLRCWALISMVMEVV